jgi:hypothetical protein
VRPTFGRLLPPPGREYFMSTGRVLGIVELLYENVTRGVNTFDEARKWAVKLGDLTVEERLVLDVALSDPSQLKAFGERIVAKGPRVYPTWQSRAARVAPREATEGLPEPKH